MIPRTMRLSRAHFAPHGPEKRLTSPHFSLSVRQTDGNGGCAAVVAKKVARLSVTRHKLKRRMLAVIGPWCSEGRALVVYARAGSPTLPFSALEEELTELLLRALGHVG